MFQQSSLCTNIQVFIWTFKICLGIKFFTQSFGLNFTLGWLGHTYWRSYMWTASLTSMLRWCTWHNVFWGEQQNYLTQMYRLSSTWTLRFSLNKNIGSHNRCILSNSSIFITMQHAAPCSIPRYEFLSIFRVDCSVKIKPCKNYVASIVHLFLELVTLTFENISNSQPFHKIPRVV